MVVLDNMPPERPLVGFGTFDARYLFIYLFKNIYTGRPITLGVRLGRYK